jgi:hypothetical protein
LAYFLSVFEIFTREVPKPVFFLAGFGGHKTWTDFKTEWSYDTQGIKKIIKIDGPPPGVVF